MNVENLGILINLPLVGDFMNIFKNYLIVAIFAPATCTQVYPVTPYEFIRNYNLPLVHKDGTPIYQIGSITDLGGSTCGFFTLKNARDLESLMGFNKPCDIKQNCNNYVDDNGIKPGNGLSNKQMV